MKPRSGRWLIALLAATAAGCAATGAPFVAVVQPPADGCAFYLYRVAKLAAAGSAPRLYIDGKEDGALLRNGAYLRREAPCGKRFVELRHPAFTGLRQIWIETTLEPGRAKYLRYRIDFDGIDVVSRDRSPYVGFDPRWWLALEEVDASQALGEIGETGSID